MPEPQGLMEEGRCLDPWVWWRRTGTRTPGFEGRGQEVWILHSRQEDVHEPLLALGEEGLELGFKFPGEKGLGVQTSWVGGCGSHAGAYLSGRVCSEPSFCHSPSVDTEPSQVAGISASWFPQIP